MKFETYIDVKYKNPGHIVIIKNSVEAITNFTLKNLLYGNELLNQKENQSIFDAVHTYIIRSNRFN